MSNKTLHVALWNIVSYYLLLLLLLCVSLSNGNASETKANESFDNGVFFYIEAKRTRSIVEHLFRSEVKMFILKNLKLEVKQTCLY
jgi:hypothetical protein